MISGEKSPDFINAETKKKVSRLLNERVLYNSTILAAPSDMKKIHSSFTKECLKMRKYFALIGAMLSLFIMAGCQGLKLSADTAAVVNYHSSHESVLEKGPSPARPGKRKKSC